MAGDEVVEQVGETLLAAAVPFAELRDAVSAAVDQLEALGHGRWELADVSLDDLAETDRLTVPIVVPDGSRLVVVRRIDTAGALSVEDLEAVVSAGRLVATLLAAGAETNGLRARAERAEEDSVTDSLTGVVNGRAWRRALLREAARCDRRQLTAVVVVVDLDNLKTINDRDGHLAGDLALRGLADALSATVRVTDVVARLGGDEFGVLAVDSDLSVLDRVVERLRTAVAAAGIAASIGGALYRPGGRIDATFELADAEMYGAKRAKRALGQTR